MAVFLFNGFGPLYYQYCICTFDIKQPAFHLGSDCRNAAVHQLPEIFK